MFVEHLKNVKLILQRLKELGIKLKAERCFSFKTEVKYLRQIINSEDYGDDPVNIAAIEKLKETPKNVVDFQKLIGFTGY